MAPKATEHTGHAKRTERYAAEKGKLMIQDPEMGLDICESFSPARLPKSPKDGQKLPDGHVVKAVLTPEGSVQEHYMDLRGKNDGEARVYFPGGAIAMECFYMNGSLHGPSTVFSEAGVVLSKSWYVNGKQEGKSHWYYPSGALYSLQLFRNGLWDGCQKFYYEDGSPKSLLEYKHGKLIAKELF
jgi:antitoxin component YwqK of YwqJK toxin-antitoxin module